MKSKTTKGSPLNRLIILCGIPFAGKSTLAKRLEKELNAVRIDLDDIKFKHFGKSTRDEELTQQDWDTIYTNMYAAIETKLKSGNTIIHDTGNFTRHERSIIQSIAAQQNVPFVTVFVDTPVSVARQRLLANRQIKNRFDITDEQYQSAVAEMETPDQRENVYIFQPNSSVDKLIAQLST